MEPNPARRFRSGHSYVAEICTWRILLLFLVSAGCSLLVGFRAERDPELQKLFEVCEGRRRCHSNPWQALLVGNVLLVATAMMMNGYRSYYVFLAAVTFFGVTGVISTQQALAGFSSPGNIAFQAVLVLVGGIRDSGVLDHMFSRLLGPPSRQAKAFLRVQLVTAFLGAFVQQTMVVVAAAPALQRWAPQAKVSTRELLLPITHVAAMAQNLMVVTSTVALTIYQTMPEAQMHMLDPALGCMALTALTCAYNLLATPLLGHTTLQRRSSREHMKHQCQNRYSLTFEVAKGSFLINSTVTQAGLLSVAGAVLIDTDFPTTQPMAAGNRLTFAATAAGVARIRNGSPGLVLEGDPLAVLGAQRHKRRLFEVGISPGSSLVGCKPPICLNQGSLLAARRPQAQSLVSPMPTRRPYRGSPDTESVVVDTAELGEFSGALAAGDILLVEAFLEFADLPEVENDFSFVALVPESAPPRHGRPVDQHRGWLALLLLFLVILFSVANVCDLVFLGLAAVGCCIMLNIVHRESVLQRLDLSIFLTIAGGLGVGQAIKASGLANAWAQLVVAAGKRVAFGHPIGILLALSFISSVLANLMSHTATAALMAPIAMKVCMAESMNVKAAAMVLTFSANASFTTPFASAANIMIKGMGPYEAADFVRYGIPLQVLCLFAIPSLCAWQFGVSAPPEI
ncbi:unnamed protein product [Effrenium voratum]|uniref:Citrate transporter-like domain-containing protein n=1 Tax=Effrenium voratum TaxID=2562239 RepID=A0AA36IQC2_9DINO|nr:unnamed protein product [Effrenium voratum]CAJ1390728.1 unnamed protein product [Effrenium voratum]CAJ1425144.1 unnamed protein product [Effrenium voratum]